VTARLAVRSSDRRPFLDSRNVAVKRVPVRPRQSSASKYSSSSVLWAFGLLEAEKRSDQWRTITPPTSYDGDRE